MKKVYTTKKYKWYHNKHSLIIAKKSREKKVLRNNQKKCLNSETLKGFDSISAPSELCIKENPEGVTKFINRINNNFRSRVNTFIDLSNISKISHDAIIILLSIMTKFKKYNIPFNGNFPKDEKCSQILLKSGFLPHLYHDPHIKYDTKSESTNIIRRHGNTAIGALASDIIKISSQNIWGCNCRCQGVYRIIMELMQNTHAHASTTKAGQENWWLSVNYNKEKNIACFSFVDYGIGIFNSLQSKKKGNKFFGALEKIKQTLLEPSNEIILSKILDGELHRTVTQKNYRGKGIPGIKMAMERNQISNLYIITNNAYADVGNNIFKKLKNDFAGTFIYWELTENNIKCNGTNN